MKRCPLICKRTLMPSRSLWNASQNSCLESPGGRYCLLAGASSTELVKTIFTLQQTLSRIIKNGPKSPIPYIMAFDLVFAGIDTTGNTLSFLIYNLSRNQDKQEKLRKEIQSFGRSVLTVQDVGQMPYFKACLQESFRLSPTLNSLIRVLPQDSVIGGHKIPAGMLNAFLLLLSLKLEWEALVKVNECAMQI